MFIYMLRISIELDWLHSLSCILHLHVSDISVFFNLWPPLRRRPITCILYSNVNSILRIQFQIRFRKLQEDCFQITIVRYVSFSFKSGVRFCANFLWKTLYFNPKMTSRHFVDIFYIIGVNFRTLNVEDHDFNPMKNFWNGYLQQNAAENVY